MARPHPAQLALDLDRLPLSWRESIVPGIRTQLCGSVCIGTVVRLVDGYRAYLGHVGERHLVGDRPTEPEAMAILEIEATGSMSGRAPYWLDVSEPGVPSEHLYLGDVMIARLHPWHATMNCWPEVWVYRPRDMRDGMRVVMDEAIRRLAA